MRSVLKGKLGAAEYNVYAVLSGTTSSIFVTEFDPFFFGLSFFLSFSCLKIFKIVKDKSVGRTSSFLAI